MIGRIIAQRKELVTAASEEVPSVWHTVTAWRRAEEPLYGTYSYRTLGFRIARTKK